MNHHDHAEDSCEANKLRYRVHLWRKDGTRQLLAKAATVALGRAIFKTAVGNTVTRLLGRDPFCWRCELLRLAREQHVIVAIGVPNNRASDCHLHILGQISQQAYRVIH